MPKGARVAPPPGASAGVQLDPQSAMQMTLTVLQRQDPAVEEILFTAGHVTVYEFDVAAHAWGRKDVEGSLFIVKRKSQPRFQLLVLNRRSPDNLVEDLLGGLQYEVQAPYLLYRNVRDEVNGVWFYSPKDCEAVAKLLARITSTFGRQPARKPPAAPQPPLQELEAHPSQLLEAPLEPTPALLPPLPAPAAPPQAPPLLPPHQQPGHPSALPPFFPQHTPAGTPPPAAPVQDGSLQSASVLAALFSKAAAVAASSAPASSFPSPSPSPAIPAAGPPLAAAASASSLAPSASPAARLLLTPAFFQQQATAGAPPQAPAPAGPPAAAASAALGQPLSVRDVEGGEYGADHEHDEEEEEEEEEGEDEHEDEEDDEEEDGERERAPSLLPPLPLGPRSASMGAPAALREASSDAHAMAPMGPPHLLPHGPPQRLPSPHSASSSSSLLPAPSPADSIHPSHGAPFLQPFPPPAPPPSLTPTAAAAAAAAAAVPPAASAPGGGFEGLLRPPMPLHSLSLPSGAAADAAAAVVVTREGLRSALLRLVQDEHFLDMLLREIARSQLPD